MQTPPSGLWQRSSRFCRNKTGTDSNKSKKRQATPENRLVFKNVHPAIIDEETWNIVQLLQGTKRRPYKLDSGLNPLTGVLYCADCGAKLYHKQGKSSAGHYPHDEYCCSNYRHYTNSCTCHYTRVSVIQELILTTIRRVSSYVRDNEAAFIERVRKESALQQEAVVKESRKKLAKDKRRRDKISGFIKKLYASYAAGKIPEKHFSALFTGYDAEQTTLDGHCQVSQRGRSPLCYSKLDAKSQYN